MKYLKRIFESTESENVKFECDDILLELKDLGYLINITVDGEWVRGDQFTNERSWIRVVISKKESDIKFIEDGSSFKINDVIEYIDRLDDYLSKLGFQPDDDYGGRYHIKTDAIRNPNDFSIDYVRSFVNLWYSRTRSS